MARVKGAMMTRKRRIKTLKLAKGYWGSKSKHFKMAKQAVMKSGQYAYIGRKQKKRDFRSLWITRISAAAKMNGMNYSTFMNGLNKAGVTLNRKMLSEIAIADPAAFTALTEKAKEALDYCMQVIPKDISQGASNLHFKGSLQNLLKISGHKLLSLYAPDGA